MKDIESILSLVNMLSGGNKSNSDKNSNLDILSVLDVFMPNEDNKSDNDMMEENIVEKQEELESTRPQSNYVQYNNQKNILILVKLMEIKKLIKTYNSYNSNDKIDVYMLLNEIMPYMDKQKQNELKKYIDLVSLQKGFMNR